MSLHTDWVAAKKESVKLFKDAQKNWLKKQDAKINATNDAKAKKKALDTVLGEAGLDKGESLDDYLKFADGFGKSLDALEKTVAANEKASKALSSATLEKVLADKNMLRAFLGLCQRSGNAGDIRYYMADYKKSPQFVWDTYVKNGAKDQIEIAHSPIGGLFDDWMAAGPNPQTLATEGRALCDKLRQHVESDLKGEILRKFMANAQVKRELGISDTAALKKEVLDTAEKYNQQIERAVNKWKKLTPQFWTPLDESLQAIMRFVGAN